MNQGITSRNLRRLMGVIAATALSAAGVSAAFGQSTVSVWDGVYTEAQAKKGEAVYTASCMDCHGDDFAGREQAPALAGLGFLDKWKRTTVRRLLDTVEQMPPDEPKSLTSQQYVDVLAYILSVNGFPSGKTALPVDRAALAQLELTNVRPEKK